MNRLLIALLAAVASPLPALAAVASPLPALAETAAGTVACQALPGADRLRDSQRPDFVIMGEAHGTAELPQAFADLVCAYAQARLPLTVGLEFLPEVQPALEAYLASDGGPDARSALLAAPAWALQDGRASQAMFQLVETLRHIGQSHGDLAVVAFDHPSETPGTSALREKGMADHLLTAKRARPNAPVLALTGVGHAGKSEWTSFTPPFKAMSQYLPDAHTVAIAFDVNGGAIWGCRRPADADTETCGVWPVTGRGPVRPRGLWSGSSRKGFDATISVGADFSASPPARPEP